MNMSTLCTIKYMNRSYFSKARYMIGVGFKILGRTTVPKLPPSYPPPPPAPEQHLSDDLLSLQHLHRQTYGEYFRGSLVVFITEAPAGNLVMPARSKVIPVWHLLAASQLGVRLYEMKFKLIIDFKESTSFKTTVWSSSV